jgi:type II secretory pathway pseudopilin PulG
MTGRTKIMLLEIGCVLAILASVAVIAVPKLDDLKRRDMAAAVLTDLEGMRDAVFAFYSDSAYFPAESPAGPIPDGLRPYLPRGFASQRAYGTIAYRNWPGGQRPPPPVDTLSAVPPPVDPVPAPAAAANGRSTTVLSPNIVGAVIVASNPKVVGTAAALSPRTARFVMGNRYTFLFFGT